MKKALHFITRRPVPFAVAGIVISIVGFYFVSGSWKKLNENRQEKIQLESLVKKVPVYLDESLLPGAIFGDKIYSVFKTDEGEYALVQIVSARIKDGKFQNELNVRLPNGDLYSGPSSAFIPEMILRNGKKLPAQIIENAIATLKLPNGNYVAIQLTDANIIDGKVIDIFSGRGINSGYQIAGTVAAGEIKDGYMVTNPTYVPAKIRVFGYLVMIEERKVDQDKVLAAETEASKPATKSPTEMVQSAENGGVISRALGSSPYVYEYQGAIIKPNYDKGTYQIAGLSEGTDVTVGLIEDIVSDQLKKIDFSKFATNTNTTTNVTFEGAVTTNEIQDLTIQAVDIADNSILSRHIKDGEITSADIKNDTIKNEDVADSAINSAKIEDGTVTSTDIKDNTIGTGQLSDILTFGDGDFLDLSAISYNDTAPQGLRLPNVSSATPTSPSSGEGYMAWDTANNQVLVYNGTSWGQIGGSISLYTGSSTTSTNSSASGMELLNTNQLSLLRGCNNGELLKWNSSTTTWDCSVDSGGSGSGITVVQENDTTVVASGTTLDFLGSDFVVSESPAGEANVSIDYTNSHITRDNQTQSISGAWTFSSGLTVSGGTVSLPAGQIDNTELANSSITVTAGTGLSGGGSVSLGGTVSLASTLGTSISNAEIDADTIDWDRISDSMTLDANTSITAVSALSLTIGNNVSLVASGTGTIVATDLSCTDCIGPTEISDITLGTDTSGNYVATITAGNGLASTGATTGETIDHTLSVNTGNGIQISSDNVTLGPLTANWDQTGAFDIVLNNAGSELVILESDGGTSTGTIDVGSLSGNAVYTFTGATGNVLTDVNASTLLSAWDQNAADDLTTSNYATTLDSVYVNVGESPAAGDISGSFSGGLNIVANSVALTTDTTGNYVASVSSGNGAVSIGGSAGEGWTPSVSLVVAPSADALSSTTSSGSGLEILSSGVAMLQGCSDGQLLKWNETSDVWACSADNNTGTNYWVASAGVLSPDGINGSVLAATSAAATVATFTSTGTNNAFAAGSAGNYLTISSTGALSTAANVSAGSVTTGGDTINDFTGTGLAMSGNSLTATLGTSISNTEIDSNTIDFDKISNSLTLDAATTVTAGSSTNFTVGNNVNFITSGTGTITATDLSCTDCIGPTEISVLTLGTDTDGNYVSNVSSGNAAITIGGSAGEGWTPSVSLALLSATDALSATTSNGSGLEVISGQGLGLLQGCADGQILKWNESTDTWACSADATGGGAGSSFTTISTPAGTSPTADTSTDTVSLLASGTNFTITGTNDPESVTFDIDESVLAGAGLAANGSALDVSTGNGIQVTSDALALGALTANWNQTGAFDIVLNNAGSELVILESDGGTSTGTIDVGSLSGDAVYTFVGSTGNVITSTNAATQLSTWDQNASDDVTTFLGLTDTPSSYSGQGLKVVRVNSGATALEFVDPATLGTNYFSRAAGNIFPTTSNDTLSATSGAATVATFTSTGTNNAFAAGSAGNYLTISSTGALSTAANVSAGSVTTGGDTINDFTGTGLAMSGNSLTATLGTSISNTEIDSNTIDFDKISNSLTLDAATTITAGSALSFLIGNNVTFQATGTGQIIATDLSCTDCIGPTELSDITLGTDTAGNYVATITAGNGLASTGATTGETIDHTLSVNTGNGIQIVSDNVVLGPLTANWDQTGAFDIVLNNAGSELVILESDGGTSTGTIDVGSLSGNAVYTFTGATGNVLTDANYTGTLDSVYVNVSESPTAADISGSFSAGLTINTNSVALTTDTTGNYVANVSSGNGAVSIGGSAGEGWTPSVSLVVAPSADALSSTTSSGSGLEILASGVAMLQGCSDTQVLKWNEASDVWACSSDLNTGTNYWVKSAGVLSPNGTDGEVIAATSGATTVATFTATSGINALLAGTTGSYFTVNQNGSISIPSSQTVTIGGDSISDFVGTGLALSGSTLTASLGTSISNGEIDNDTINFDKIDSALTLDEATTISASGALSLLIGNNVTFQTTGTGQIIASDLSCTDCIGTTEIADSYLLNSGDTGAGTYAFTLGASDTFTIDGATTDSTVAGGAFVVNVDTSTSGNTGLSLNYAVNDNAGAGPTSPTAQEIGVTANDANATGVTGLSLAQTDAAGTVAALLLIEDLDSTVGSLTDAIKINSTGVNGGITDAIDVSDSNITNGINLGTNNIILNGDTVNDFTGNGITISGSALTINLDTGSGLVVGASGLSLLRTCGTDEILKWNGTSWVCTAQTSGTNYWTKSAGVLSPNGTDGSVIAATSSATTVATFTAGGSATALRAGGTANYLTVDVNGDIGSSDALTIASGGGAGLTLNSASNTLTIDSSDTTLTGSGLTTVTLGPSVTFTNASGDIILGPAGASTTGQVYIGGSSSSTTPDLLVLGRKSDAGDPTGVTGAIYYNNAGKFMIYEGTQWKELCNKTDAACGAGSGSAWSALTAPTANLSLNMNEWTTTLSSNTNDTTAAAFDSFTFSLTNDAATDSNIQRVLVLQNNNTATTNTTERLLVLNNADTNAPVTTAMEILSSGGAITTALDVSDSDIVTALSAGQNDLSGTSWSITGSSGAASFVGVNSGTGLLQGTGGLTLTGTTSINDSASTSTTNIGTGTTTGAVAIGGGSNTLAINTTNWDVSSAGAFTGLTGLSSSGTVNFSGLTANSIVATDGSKNLVSSISSANLAGSITDETGSGLAVFGTSPTISTSLVTDTSTFTLLAAATTLNIGPTGNSGSIVLSGGSSDTGCTLNGVNGDLTCSGNITGAATGTIGYWQRLAGNLSPATTSDTISATSGATTVATFTASGTNTAFRAGGATNVVTIDSSGNLVAAGTLAVNGDTITSDGTTLIINAAGNVDVQDALNADSITSDAGVSIAAGNSYTGAGAVTLSTGAGGNLTLDANGAGTTILADATITLSGLTASRALFLDSSKNISTTAASADLASSLSDETGSTGGVVVFSNAPAITSPSVSTSIVAGTSTFTLLSAATTLNIGPTGSGASTIAFSGGSGDTGCTLNGDTGNFTCTGNITGASTGTVGYWQRLAGNLSPATTTDTISATSGAATVATFTASGTNTAFRAGGATNVVTIDSSGNLVAAGTLAVNGDTITSDGTTLIINAAGNVDIQDALNADSITSDAGVSIAAGNSYTGAGAVTLSTGAGGNLTLDANGAGMTVLNDTTIQFGASSTLQTNSATADTLTINNAGAGTLDLNLTDGALKLGGTTRISNAGAGTFVGVDSGSGLLQGTGGFTLTGTTSINDSASTSTTNIGTGTTTGAVAIGGGSNTLAINTTNWDVSSAGAFTGLTGLSSSGTITFSGLTASRGVFTTTGGQLTSSGTSQYLIDSLSDETGSGALVFGTSPAITTSLTTSSTSFDLLNANATTINFGGGATTALNIGPTGATATSVNIAGGSSATGCTVDGATGNLTCSGNITGASTGTAGYWQRLAGNLSPATTTDTISATSGAATVATFTASGTNTAFRAGGATNVVTIDSSGNLVAAGTLAVNGDTITSDGTTLIINAAGNVDIQDALNADSITSDAGVSIAAGQNYTGAGAVNITTGAGGDLTLDANGAGKTILNDATIQFGASSTLQTNSATADTLTINNAGAGTLDLNLTDGALKLGGTTRISNAGAGTFVGVDSGSGLLQGTGGLTLTGTTSINDSASTSTTNIGTGTTTGAVAIGGGSNTFAINTTNWDVSSAGAFTGLTGLSSSGTINFSGLTANSIVATDGSKNLVSSISSANLAGSITDETGSGLAVFGTSPAITTSLTTGSTSFDLLNANATTINFGGGATTALNIGPTGATATSVNIAGGSSATGCTVDGATGNLTCSGNITGASSGTAGYWQRNTTTLAQATAGDNVLIGDSGTTTNFQLEVNGKQTGNALVSLTETGDQNIITASSSASTTVFNLTRTGNLQVAAGSGLDTISAGILGIGDTTATTVNLGSTAATAINIGAGGSLTRAIAIGTGTGIDTINIGTGGTGADVIGIGSANAGNVTINTAATLALGSNTGTSTVNINSGSGGINLNTSINNAVNIGTGTSTGTVTLGGTGTQTIAVGNGAGVKTVNLGSNNTTSTTTLLSGSGGLNLNANNNQPTNIGTGTSTGLVSIGGGSGTAAVNTTNWDVSSAGAFTGLTGLSSSGTINFSGLTASSIVATDASKNLVSTISSLNLSGSITDETGSGLAVFGTSPAITTSLTTGSTSFDLLNANATTINFGGGATTALNIGPTGATATSVNIAGGSSATGCTVDGATGNLTCSGNISGASTGTLGYWSRAAGNLSPATTTDTISATSGAATVATFTASGTNNALIAGSTGNYMTVTSTGDLTFSGTGDTITGPTAGTFTIASANSNGLTLDSASGTVSLGTGDNLSVPGGTVTGANSEALVIGATNDEISMTIGGAKEYFFNATTFDAGGNTITNVGTNITGAGALTVASTTNGLTLDSGNGTVSIASGDALGNGTWSLTSAGVLSGLTGLTSSGTITFSGLTASRGVFTTTGGQLTSSGTSQYLIDSLSDETGSGALVFGTSPAITTSLTTSSPSFDLLNANATTINFGGGATTALNIGPTGATATSVNIAGGSSATGCTVDGATGNLTCSGNITGASSGTAGYWQRLAGNLSPATTTDTISATSGAATVATFTASGTNTAFRAGGATNVVTIDSSGNLVAAGDAAVNGGNVTSTGALDIASGGSGALSLTPAGAMTLGATTQTATLQGSTASITSTGAGNDITLTSADQIILNAGSTIELQDSTNLSGSLDLTGTIQAGSSNVNLTDATGFILHDALVDCADGQILKWATGGGRWGCASDNTGGAGAWTDGTNTIYPASLTKSVVIGSSSDTAGLSKLFVTNESAYTGKAVAIFNQPENQDIFSASAGGQTRLTLTNVGNLQFSQASSITTTAGNLTLDSAANTVLADATINLSGLTASRALFLDSSKNISTTAASADLASSLSDETGSTGGVVVFSNAPSITSPSVSTSIVAGTSTFTLLSAATTLNIGPTGSGASTIAFSGGSGDTGCTLNGDTGNFTCSGNITGASTGTVGYWTKTAQGILQPANNEPIAATSSATTVATFTQAAGTNTLALKAGGSTNFMTVDIDGDIVTAGDVAINGGNITSTGALDIASGGTGDLTLTPAGGNILSSSPLNIGGAAQQPYNFFATSTATNSNADSVDDVFIGDELEVEGSTLFDLTAGETLNIQNSTMNSTASLLYVAGTNAAAGSVNATGVQFDFTNSNDANAETHKALFVNVTNNGTSATDNVYGVQVNQNSGSGAALTAGLYINNNNATQLITNGILFENTGGGGYTNYLNTPSIDISGAGVISGATGITSTGAIDFGGATTLKVPNSATPTVNATGLFAVDTDFWGASRGAYTGYDGTSQVVFPGILASDTCANGEVPKFNTGGTWTCEVDNNSGGTNYWQLVSTNSTALAPYNTTLDLFVGGTATSSAKLAAYGIETAAGGVADINSTVTTTGDVLGITSSSLTGGNLLNLNTGSANTLNTGRLLNLASTATSVTTGGMISSSFTGNSAFSGNLNYFDWSPTSSTTATGDIFRINIGSSGTTSGNIFNVTDNGSTLFSVSESQVTSNLPTQFTTSGDVTISNQLVFSNQTASSIVAKGPLTIDAGESFESNDLTLKTYNSGQVLVDSTALGGLGVSSNISGSALDGLFSVEGQKTGKALVILNETGDQNILAASASGSTVFTLARSGAVTISPASALTTAIDLTDADLTNAISVADNNIIGTTAAIDFTNFDVASTGAVTLLGGLSPDITTQGTNNLTLAAAGAGVIVLNDTTRINSGTPATNGVAYSADGNGTIAFTATGLSGNLCLLSNNGGVPAFGTCPGGGTNFWTNSAGVISPDFANGYTVIAATSSATTVATFTATSGVNNALMAGSTGNYMTVTSTGDMTFSGTGDTISGPTAGTFTIQSLNSQNLALATTTAGNITLTPAATGGLVNILTGNLKVGAGTPGVTLNGDDAYITGTFEVDGTSQFDGNLTENGTATFNSDVDFSLTNTENVTFSYTSQAPTLDMVSISNSGMGTLSDGVDAFVSSIYTVADTAADTNSAIHAIIGNTARDASDVINGLEVTGIANTVASSTQNLINLTPATSGNTAGSLNGINIAAIGTPGSATETAINIGTGWDKEITFADTTPTISIGDTGTLTINDGTNTLLTLADSTNLGNLGITGDLTISGGDIISSVTMDAITTIGDASGNDYLSFTEYDAAATCSAGDYFIWARSGTTNKFQKCQNGTISDLDTNTGGTNYWALTTGTGVINPDVTTGASVLAATSAATTVATFNTSGTNAALLVTSSGNSLTVPDLLLLTQTGTSTTVTDAIDVSDETITNALNIGTNQILASGSFTIDLNNAADDILTVTNSNATAGVDAAIAVDVGTAGNPGFTFVGDTNTGIYRLAAEKLALAGNGQPGLYFSGASGTGQAYVSGTELTDSDWGKFNVYGTMTGKALVMLNDLGADQDYLTASAAGTTKFRLRHSGELFMATQASAPETCNSGAQGNLYTNSTDNNIYYCDGTGWVDLTVQGGAGPWTDGTNTIYPTVVGDRVGIGSTTEANMISKLYVTNDGALTGKALAIFDQTENQDIITASGSGTKVMSLTKAGNLNFFQNTVISTDSHSLALGTGAGSSSTLSLYTGDSTAGSAALSISTGLAGVAGNSSSGNITIQSGSSVGTSAPGSIFIDSGIPDLSVGGAINIGNTYASSINIGNSTSTVQINSGNAIANGIAYATDVNGTIAYTTAPSGTQCLQFNGSTYVWTSCGGTNYWALTSGVVRPDVTAGASVIAATSAATTVATFTSGANNKALSITTAAQPTVDIATISNSGQGTTTTGVDGLVVDFYATDDLSAGDFNAAQHIILNSDNAGGDTMYGLQLSSNVQVTTSGSILTGIQIDNITNGGGTETAINIGTGWDTGLSINSGGATIAAGALAVNSDSITSDGTLTINATNTVFLGNGTDGLQVDETWSTTTSGFKGAARPTKTVTYSPEYAGAVLTTTYIAGTDTSTSGTMTSDTATASGTLRNYYEWKRTQTTQNFYTVAVKIALPKDFSDWPSSGNGVTVNFATNTTTATDNLLDVYLYREDSTATPVVFSTNNKSGTAATWTTVGFTGAQLNDNVNVDWDTADQVATIYLRMGSQSSNWTRIGDIQLNYLAKF